ncbi:MAG TPA: MlaE family lipid ABC transporter permease subunit [Candidatus Acidoferrum sp.]|nr:MlaE family lipid ABC transporter permease subunit [Candidatus Acidoferrum sp.]
MGSRLAYRLEAGPAGEVLHLEGDVDRAVARELAELLAARRAVSLTLDLSRVALMDSAGVGALVDGWRRSQAGLVVGPTSAGAEQALTLFRVGQPAAPPPAPPALVESMGGAAYAGADAVQAFLQLAADAAFGLAAALTHPRRIRWTALAEQALQVGARALRIVALIVFLVGLTVAFQAAYQLRQFGAAVYVADLSAVSIVREMGPLMTAILVAGRSGSSIAAEIATMQVSEEVDALRVMGIDPIEYLAVPRLLALVLVMPLLTVLADLVGIAGGFLVGVLYLDLAGEAFLRQAMAALSPFDLVTGTIKAVAFAFGIGLIGLFYGMRVRGGASEVGRTTTASVVTSIFYIIVADCFFSIVFYILL